jgi:hypothetical protein
MEQHEAEVWAQCAAAASALPGDPLRVVIDRSGPVTLVALRAVDRPDLNRVIGLGTLLPARAETVDAICSFYEVHEQECFRVEVTPVARPSGIDMWIAARGLLHDERATFKLWRSVQPPLVAPSNVDVRRLDSGDADAIASLNDVAWGAWGNPLLRAWFGATVGCGGAQHYGVFDRHRLVATGALFVHGELGWFGFDATHPRYQGGRLRQAISALRLQDAVAQGCSIVHAESAIPLSPRAARDGWKLLYEKQNYSSAGAETAPSVRKEPVGAATYSNIEGASPRP